MTMDNFEAKKKKALASLHGTFVDQCAKKFRFSSAEYRKLLDIAGKFSAPGSVIRESALAIRKRYAEEIAEKFNSSELRSRELAKAVEMIGEEEVFLLNLSNRTNRENFSLMLGDFEEFLIKHGLTGNLESETKTNEPEKDNVIRLFPEGKKQ